jgi:hypothetical protein
MTSEDARISQTVQELKDLAIAIRNTTKLVTPTYAEFMIQNIERIAVQLKMMQSNPYGDLNDRYLFMIQTGLDLAEEIK